MRIKKGFTLAEILIVLMIIGVIAMLTIPSMMKGVTEAQLKAGYKKAYNTIVNLCAMERVSGGLPAKAESAQAIAFYHTLANNLSVRNYLKIGDLGNNNITTIDSGGKLLNSSHLNTAAIVGGQQAGNGNNPIADTGSITATVTGTVPTEGYAPWIITEDGIAYTVALGGATGGCGNKADINSTDGPVNAALASCLVLIVDVNGPGKGPNQLEKQKTTTNGVLQPGAVNTPANASQKLVQLTGDQYLIYIGQDGATAGPSATTVTGRLVSEMQ